MIEWISVSRRRLAALLWVAAVPVLSVSVAAEEGEDALPSFFELTQNYLEANGGLMNIKSVRSVKVSGRSRQPETEPIEFTAFRKRPDMMRIITAYPGFDVEAVVDGERASKRIVGNTGEERVLEMGEAERRQLVMDSKMDGPFFQLVNTPEWVTVDGVEEVDGAPAIRLLVSPEAELPYRKIWLSEDHYQEVKLEYRRDRPEEWLKAGAEVYFEDFRKSDGVWFAHRIRYFSGDELVREIEVENIRTNVGIFDSYFRVDSRGGE